jgi:hypothetical protein
LIIKIEIELDYLLLTGGVGSGTAETAGETVTTDESDGKRKIVQMINSKDEQELVPSRESKRWRRKEFSFEGYFLYQKEPFCAKNKRESGKNDR